MWDELKKSFDQMFAPKNEEKVFKSEDAGIDLENVNLKTEKGFQNDKPTV